MSMITTEVTSLLNGIFAILNAFLSSWVQGPAVVNTSATSFTFLQSAPYNYPANVNVPNPVALNSAGQSLVAGIASIVDSAVKLLSGIVAALAQ